MKAHQSILYALLSLITPFLGNAQTNSTARVGLIVGSNLSRFAENPASNNRFRLSYSAGVTLEQQLSKRLSVSADLKYSRQENIEQLANPLPLYQKIVTHYDYLVIPAALRLRGKRVPISLIGGLQVGYLLQNEVVLLPQAGSTYTNNNNPPFLRKTDFSWLAGVGHNLGKHLFAEISCNQSMVATTNRGQISNNTLRH